MRSPTPDGPTPAAGEPRDPVEAPGRGVGEDDPRRPQTHGPAAPKPAAASQDGGHDGDGREDRGDNGREDRGRDDRGHNGHNGRDDRGDNGREDRGDNGREDRRDNGRDDRGDNGREDRGDNGRDDRGDNGREDRGEDGRDDGGERVAARDRAGATSAEAGDSEPADLRERPTERIDVRHRPTERIDVRDRPTERIDVGNRPTVRLPRQRTPSTAGRAPLIVAGPVTALFAAVVSYLPVAVALALAQLTEGRGGFAGAAGGGLAAWLLAHGVPLGTSVGPLSLPPLAVAAFAAWRVARAGVHTSRAYGVAHRGSPRQAAAVAAAVGLGYGVVGALAALVADRPGLDVPVLRASVNLTVFGTAAALVGALRSTGALRVAAVRMPPVLRDGIRTGVVGAILVLGAGAAMAGLAIALGGGNAADVIGAYRTGVAGQVGITLICLAYAPNVATWAAAYLLGPGFALGADTTVRTTEVNVGTLLPLPLAAGVPDGPVGALGALLLAVPLVAGMVAGWLLARRVLRLRAGDSYARRRSWRALVGAAALGGPVAGVLLGLASFVSGGAVGGPRLAEMGPVGWQVAIAGAIVVTIGSAVGAAATRALAGP